MSVVLAVWLTAHFVGLVLLIWADPKGIRAQAALAVGPCPCECNRGGFCGGCGHAGCGGRR